MRKGNKTKKLGRNKARRDALIKIQIKHLIEKGFIRTTVSKAKVLKGQFDVLMNYVNNKNERRLKQYLINDKYISQLKALEDKERVSGFTTLVKLGTRRGDNAEMALLEIIKKDNTEKVAAGTSGKSSKSQRAQ